MNGLEENEWSKGENCGSLVPQRGMMWNPMTDWWEKRANYGTRWAETAYLVRQRVGVMYTLAQKNRAVVRRESKVFQIVLTR